MKMKKISRLLEASFHRLAQTLMFASSPIVVEPAQSLPLMSGPPVEDRLFAYKQRPSAQEQLERSPDQHIGCR